MEFSSSAPCACGDVDLRRTLQLTALRDWCLERLSTLSLADQMPLARALTAEHLELLEQLHQPQTLWMVIEADS